MPQREIEQRGQSRRQQQATRHAAAVTLLDENSGIIATRLDISWAPAPDETHATAPGEITVLRAEMLAQDWKLIADALTRHDIDVAKRWKD